MCHHILHGSLPFSRMGENRLSEQHSLADSCQILYSALPLQLCLSASMWPTKDFVRVSLVHIADVSNLPVGLTLKDLRSDDSVWTLCAVE